ncbi:MAG: hypothetical protein ACXWVB_11920 [Rhodoplanes sp.]
MIERDDIVVAVVAAAGGGGLTGRTRLQKTVYLLDQLGLNSGFQYDYASLWPVFAQLRQRNGRREGAESVEGRVWPSEKRWRDLQYFSCEE